MEKEVSGVSPPLYFSKKATKSSGSVEQIDVYKRQDLSQNHTARELAERFQVAETSLKNYFRGVFGENLSTFLREARMRRAAELLQSSELRVAAVSYTHLDVYKRQGRQEDIFPGYSMPRAVADSLSSSAVWAAPMSIGT